MSSLIKNIETESGIKIPYHSNNTFCYDNEAFRYLCIIKNIDKYTEEQKKKILSSQVDYEKSWEKSVETTYEMFNYVGTLKLHEVKETISLNDARNIITNLAEPVARVVLSIQRNENRIAEEKREVEKSNTAIENLKKKQYIMREVVVIKELGYPRTVCTNNTCVSYSTFQGKAQTIYSKHCHERCYLQGIDKEIIGNKGLIQCDAMSGKNCRVCGCFWELHMHITKDFTKKEEPMIDEDTKTLLSEATDKKVARNILINNLDKLRIEYEEEKKFLINASAEFANFVKQNSIVVYNDDFAKYLEFLIKEEEQKLNFFKDNKNTKLLDQMKQLKREYVAKKKIYDEAPVSNKVLTIDNMYEKIQKLYKLKHNGKDLENIMNGVKVSQKNYVHFKDNRHSVAPPKSKSWWPF